MQVRRGECFGEREYVVRCVWVESVRLELSITSTGPQPCHSCESCVRTLLFTVSSSPLWKWVWYRLKLHPASVVCLPSEEQLCFLLLVFHTAVSSLFLITKFPHSVKQGLIVPHCRGLERLKFLIIGGEVMYVFSSDEGWFCNPW